MIDAKEAARKLFLGSAFWSGLASLAAPLLAGAGSILTLHRINRSSGTPLGLNSHLTISPEFLDQLLGELKRCRFSLVSLDDMLEGLARGRRGMIAVTIDDGWLDNLTDALPVFERHAAPFTAYVAPGLITGAVAPWWEVVEEFCVQAEIGRIVAACRAAGGTATPEQSRRALARTLACGIASVAEEDQQAFLREAGALDETSPRKFMTWDELRRLAAHPLATIGAHTVHHYNLKRLPAEKALAEMTGSSAMIEAETGRRPQHFAYPYGFAEAVGPREIELARQAGFRSAVTTRHGVLHADHARHLHALPRISVNGNFQRLSYIRTLVSGLTTPVTNRGRRLVTI